MIGKERIRIRLKAYDYRVLDHSTGEIVETAKRLAALRGESFEELAAATTRNFQALCLLQPTPNG